MLIMEKRNSLANVDADKVAELERLHYAVANSIALHRYSGQYLPTKRNRGLDWTLGENAVALGRATRGESLIGAGVAVSYYRETYHALADEE